MTDLSVPYNGRVKEITPSRGTAIIKFDNAQDAHNFKRRNLRYEIRNRPINIKIHFSNQVVHWRNRSHSRGKSTSRLMRTRTKSDCGESQGRHSSGELNMRRCSSQESLLSDVLVEDTRVVKSEPRILAVSQTLKGLSLTSRLRQLSGSSVGPSSGDEEAADRTNRPRRMHSKMKSKLKLKNRKKSEATPGFRNKPEIVDGDEEDYETDDSDLFSQQIRTNITSLIDHHQVCLHGKIRSHCVKYILSQLVRLELLNHFYRERYQSSLLSPSDAAGPARLAGLISRHCQSLIVISFNKEPHVVSRQGPFVVSYLARLHQAALITLMRRFDTSHDIIKTKLQKKVFSFFL